MSSSIRGTAALSSALTRSTSAQPRSRATKPPKKSAGSTKAGTTHTVSMSPSGALMPRRYEPEQKMRPRACAGSALASPALAAAALSASSAPRSTATSTSHSRKRPTSVCSTSSRFSWPASPSSGATASRYAVSWRVDSRSSASSTSKDAVEIGSAGRTPGGKARRGANAEDDIRARAREVGWLDGLSVAVPEVSRTNEARRSPAPARQ